MKRDTPRGRPNSPRRPRVGPDLVRYLSLLAGREPTGGLLEIRYRSEAGARMRQQWFPAGRPAPAARRIVELAERTDVYVGVAPRYHRHGGRAAIQRLWVLWADVDDPAAQGLADQLPIPPGMIVNSGSPGHRHLYWPLARPVDVEQAEHANRLLAQAVGGDTGAVLGAATILRPPATRSYKRFPPTAVTLERLEPTAHTMAEILDGLPTVETPAVLAPNAPPRAPTADPLLRVAPAEYVEVLAGLAVPRSRKVSCPFHEDRTPSLHVYLQPAEGWHCYGCGRGGSVYDLAAGLWQLDTRGPDFLALRARLHEQLLPGAA